MLAMLLTITDLVAYQQPIGKNIEVKGNRVLTNKCIPLEL